MDELRLLNKAMAGCSSSFENLMNQYIQLIYNYIITKVKNRVDVEDLLQEVMLGAYQSLSSFNQASSFKTWLIGIAKRKIADFYRKHYKEETTDLEKIEISYQEDYDEISTRMDINNILKSLSREDQELVELIFKFQLSYKEIEEITQIPLGTIKSRVHSIKAKLKPLLEGDVYE